MLKNSEPIIDIALISSSIIMNAIVVASLLAGRPPPLTSLLPSLAFSNGLTLFEPSTQGKMREPGWLEASYQQSKIITIKSPTEKKQDANNKMQATY